MKLALMFFLSKENEMLYRVKGPRVAFGLKVKSGNNDNMLPPACFYIKTHGMSHDTLPGIFIKVPLAKGTLGLSLNKRQTILFDDRYVTYDYPSLVLLVGDMELSVPEEFLEELPDGPEGE